MLQIITITLILVEIVWSTSSTTSHHVTTGESNFDIKIFNITFEWTQGTPHCDESECSPEMYAANFACNKWWSDTGDWLNGSRTFVDPYDAPLKKSPIKKDFSLTQIILTLIGRFDCGFETETNEFGVYLEQNLIESWTLNNLKPCICGNCVQELQFATTEIPTGWPGYKYGGLNRVNISVSSGVICLSVAEFTLIFTRDVPNPSSEQTTSEMAYFKKVLLWSVVSIGGFLVLVILCIAFFVIKKNKKRSQYERINDGLNDEVQKAAWLEGANPQFHIDGKEITQGSRIGKGSYGDVFKAEWRGIIVAVKKLPMSILNDPAFLKDFKQEVFIMSALRHPNVLQFLGSCFLDNDLALITEYMENGSVYRLLHENSFDMDYDLMKKWAMETAQGVLYLHNSKPPVLHRDLKSHNLLVDSNMKVKISDFGLSKVVDHLNKTMTACGTAAWAAPEVLRNARYTEKADVYSYAVCLWEFFTRRDPYEGMPTFQIIFAVGTEGMRPTLPEGAPSDYVQLIEDCWDTDPNKRPGFQEIIKRLKDLK